MDQDATLQALEHMVEPAGGLVLVGDSERIWSETVAPWQQAVERRIVDEITVDAWFACRQ